jgi:hypothetical protein
LDIISVIPGKKIYDPPLLVFPATRNLHIGVASQFLAKPQNIGAAQWCGRKKFAAPDVTLSGNVRPSQKELGQMLHPAVTARAKKRKRVQNC